LKQKAENEYIAIKGRADKYKIDRIAEGTAYHDQKLIQAEANIVAYRKQAEGLVAKINAIGQQGPGVLNRVIAEKIMPQLANITASPRVQFTTPVDFRNVTNTEQ